MAIVTFSAGRDPAVLRNRNQVLEALGCSVVSASSRSDIVNGIFATDFDLIVICNSIPPDERSRLLRLVGHYRPATRTILVSDHRDYGDAEALPANGLEVTPEPHALVDAVTSSFPGIARAA